MPLVADRVPEVADQVIVLFVSELPAASVSVVVRAMEPLLWMVKLEGKTEIVVEYSTAGLTVPNEIPLLD